MLKVSTSLLLALVVEGTSYIAYLFYYGVIFHNRKNNFIIESLITKLKPSNEDDDAAQED